MHSIGYPIGESKGHILQDKVTFEVNAYCQGYLTTSFFKLKLENFISIIVFRQDEMQIQLPMVVGKKEEAKAGMMVELEEKEVGAKKFSWEQRGDAEVKMEEGVLTSNEVRQVINTSKESSQCI